MFCVISDTFLGRLLKGDKDNESDLPGYEGRSNFVSGSFFSCSMLSGVKCPNSPKNIGNVVSNFVMIHLLISEIFFEMLKIVE